MSKKVIKEIEDRYSVIIDANDKFDQSIIKYYKKNKYLTQNQIDCLPKNKNNENKC